MPFSIYSLFFLLFGTTATATVGSDRTAPVPPTNGKGYVTNGVSAWPPDGNPAGDAERIWFGDRDEPAARPWGRGVERATRAMTPAYVRLAHVRPAGRVRSEHVPPRRAASSRGGRCRPHHAEERGCGPGARCSARFAGGWGFGWRQRSRWVARRSAALAASGAGGREFPVSLTGRFWMSRS
jgi:hypothetical protein